MTGETWKPVHEPDGYDFLFRSTDARFELRDVSAAHPEVVETLLYFLEARFDQPRRRRKALGTSSGEETVDPKLLDQLRSLEHVP